MKQQQVLTQDRDAVGRTNNGVVALTTSARAKKVFACGGRAKAQFVIRPKSHVRDLQKDIQGV
jgi:hypothetical protein